MTKILHITAHMGGGVGRVIRNLIDCSCQAGAHEHQLNCLEKANATTNEWAAAAGIGLHDCLAYNSEKLHKNLAAADVVHLHWWNHPLTYQLLADKSLPEMRVVVWSHVNGHRPPHIFTRQLVTWPDLFVVATPYSLKVPCIASMSDDFRKNKVRVVQSCAGVKHVKQINARARSHFSVGYVGTVDFCKLHSKFAEMCLKADIPHVKFIVCGEDKGGRVAQDVALHAGGVKFEFRGWVDDISTALADFDVLGYPLDEQHYGTGEQVLLEAMAAGVPPVVLDNGAERYIVKDGETGIVANSLDAYVEALEFLYRHPDKRKAMGRKARREALRRFDIRQSAEAWHQIYAELVQKEKSARPPYGFSCDENIHDLPSSLFIQSLGDSETAKLYGDILATTTGQPTEQIRRKLQNLKPIFFSQTRGTVFHYRTFFPNSDQLNHLCRITHRHRPLACENQR